MALRCPRESLSACSSDAQVQILRPSSGDVVFDPAPELELSAIIRDDGVEDYHQIRVLLDGNYVIELPLSAGQVQLSGLKNGLHNVHVQMVCKGSEVASSTSLFIYMTPEDDKGDADEWQLSWVKSLDYKHRLRMIYDAFKTIAQRHQEEVQDLRSQLEECRQGQKQEL
ncbi:hypothetical protein GUITHDRAFT_151002 [Guillardia theta CCMP2712]|uniref:Uncharacterized protein n=1 Tax=Guillardia theta (strain CCMP2712) TaxID=905079 RepID=L1JRS0_GUITC|nr:hypothetical protein GUITHDRAFT_151002 [Guillardia theta CCMP2712]EKX51152.1 hypothetical protein GUITHDRAFT_151002 [Guillardia theta CCMP2712]|eukprot:XP_005838132.1 hypothetical protein GUITHDRAFT_151002 [Guillardia theta CCMP2712]